MLGSRFFALGLSLVVAASLWSAQPRPAYPLPPAPKDKSQLGVGIQRTMTLLATSTPRKRYQVRILFYGQSITEQDWWKRVAEGLKKRFPNADLEIENRAIGGFGSQMLIRPAEHDLYPFYPDLLIFHVYGSNKEYEEIIRAVKSRTTAEVMMQSDHLTRWPLEVIDRDKDKGAWWDNLMNTKLLPDIAQKYGCALVPVRPWWNEYLRRNQLEPKALLQDGVHLNDHGNFLMAELIQRYLVYRPDLSKNSWQDLVKTQELGKELKWNQGKLTLSFEGNRVDILSARLPGTRASRVQVRIDGKKPSAFPGAYRITRPQPGPWSPLALVRVDHERPLLVEDWTLTVTRTRDDGKQWDYIVAGAHTGPDGQGTSDKVFVSKSGRVKIGADAWFRNPAQKVTPGYTIRWQVLPLFADEFEPAEVKVPAREFVQTVAQGLPNERHTLELTTQGGAEPPIGAVRIYRPPLR